MWKNAVMAATGCTPLNVRALDLIDAIIIVRKRACEKHTYANQSKKLLWITDC
jgi:hypothetical protein